MNTEPVRTKPPKSLLRKVGRAIADYGMIRGGDRILLGVSGGKDSLSLLAILRQFACQRCFPLSTRTGNQQLPNLSVLQPAFELAQFLAPP